MDRLGVGVALHPHLEYLELAREMIEDDADFFEVNPETLWRAERGALVRNDFHPLFREIWERSGKPFVAHGLGFSVASAAPRTAAWLARLRDDHEVFRFAWMTEHLGWTEAEGLQATLPLPLPFTDEAIRAVGERVRLLATVVPTVGLENTADYFALGDPVAWPDFMNRLLRGAGCRLLLDLHNLYTQCLNFGTDPVETLDRLDLDPVLELHLSGGSESDPAWLPSRRTFRLDSHDGPVPEPVWSLFERALPRCSGLRGVVVERLNGTFRAGDVPALRQEVRRAQEMFPC